MGAGRRTVGVIVVCCLVLTGCGSHPAGTQHPARPTRSARPSAPSAVHATSPTVSQPSKHPSPTTSTAHTAKPARRPVIVIDPGHSGHDIRQRNKATGLIDFDYPNYPEITEVFDVSTCVAANLRQLGYRVILTKKNAESTVSLTRRAEIANNAHADLAISVHDDHSQTPSFQAVYSQRGVKHDGHYHAMWRGSGATYTKFDLPKVARESARYTRIIAAARSKAQHRPVEITEEDFSGRSGLEPGNLALVQLLATVPWVYSESGALTDGSTTRQLPISAETAYAKGILDGIVAAVPVKGAEPESTAAMRQCILQHTNK